MNYVDAMDEFFRYLIEIGRSKETVDTYRNHLCKYYKYLCKLKNREIYIGDITSDDFEMYLLDDNIRLSSNSKFGTITAFKSFLSYCFKKELCTINISKQIRQIKCRTKEKISLTEEEFQLLVDNISEITPKCTVYMMFYTGCRIGELVKLKMNDVDLDKNCIFIRKAKNGKDRIIPINYKLRSILLEYLSIREDTENNNNFFILKRSGGISDSTINKYINEAAKKAKLDKPITNHIMRHTFASLLAERGIDLKRIQLLLGHSNIDITNIYLHASKSSLREAINLL